MSSSLSLASRSSAATEDRSVPRSGVPGSRLEPDAEPASSDSANSDSANSATMAHVSAQSRARRRPSAVPPARTPPRARRTRPDPSPTPPPSPLPRGGDARGPSRRLRARVGVAKRLTTRGVHSHTFLVHLALAQATQKHPGGERARTRRTFRRRPAGRRPRRANGRGRDFARRGARRGAVADRGGRVFGSPAFESPDESHRPIAPGMEATPLRRPRRPAPPRSSSTCARAWYRPPPIRSRGVTARRGTTRRDRPRSATRIATGRAVRRFGSRRIPGILGRRRPGGGSFRAGAISPADTAKRPGVSHGTRGRVRPRAGRDPRPRARAQPRTRAELRRIERPRASLANAARQRPGRLRRGSTKMRGARREQGRVRRSGQSGPGRPRPRSRSRPRFGFDDEDVAVLLGVERQRRVALEARLVRRRPETLRRGEGWTWRDAYPNRDPAPRALPIPEEVPGARAGWVRPSESPARTSNLGLGRRRPATSTPAIPFARVHPPPPPPTRLATR